MPRKNLMLCYPFEEKRLGTWRPPFITQPKLDGERCRALFTGGSWVLLSSEENIFVSVPHVLRGLRQSEICPREGLELDGELYVHGLPFEAIHSIVSRKQNLHPDFLQVKFFVFDLPSLEPQITRMVRLHTLSAFFPKELQVVPFRIAHSLHEVLAHYDAYLQDDFEGIIVRHLEAPYERKRSRYVMKFKPKKTDVYRIVGVNQMVDQHGVLRPAIGSFVCTSDDGAEFSVGSGMTDDFRYGNWEKAQDGDFTGKFIRINYQSINSESRNPRFPIFMEILEDDPTAINVFDIFGGLE
jgi:DNA ligase 1